MTLAKYSAALLMMALAFGCVARKSEPLELKLSKPGKKLTTKELAEGEPKAGKAKKTAKAKSQPDFGADPIAIQQDPKISATCMNLHDRFLPPFKRLKTLTAEPADGAIQKLISSNVGSCQEPGVRAGIVQAAIDSVGVHSGKIGVILPLSGPLAKLSGDIVTGMRGAFQESGIKFEDKVVLRDSGGQAQLTEKILAEMIIKDKVTLVIGGLEPAEAKVLADWSEQIMLPTIVLARDGKIVEGRKHAMRVYPDEKRLAETLADTAVKRGLKRVVILRPTGGKSDLVRDEFKAGLQARGGVVVQDLMYTPGEFPSMQAVANQIFRVSVSERPDEYRRAFRKAREQAAREHQPFDPRMVVLKPIVDFDAIFIPDDFRTVRHFAKLFRFHQVDKMVLIGNHEWRSPALIEPYDDFFDGSFFGDFIGSYTKLAPTIKVSTAGSPYFVMPQTVMSVDFQIIGYRAAKVAGMSLANPALARRHIAATLRGAQSTSEAFFGNGPVFNANGQSNWPTYVFNVNEGSLTLDGGAAAQLPVMTPANWQNSGRRGYVAKAPSPQRTR